MSASYYSQSVSIPKHCWFVYWVLLLVSGYWLLILCIVVGGLIMGLLGMSMLSIGVAGIGEASIIC